MPQNGYNVGRDVTLVFQTPYGPLQVPKITKFNPRPSVTEVQIKRMDGIVEHLRIPNGWSGTFEVPRDGSTIDDWFAQVESDYYSGINEQPSSIYETITNPNGSINQYRYNGVMLSLDDAGERSGDAQISQQMKFVASRRIKIS
ncbi:hypothetical protein [Cupriavidus basilensis]